MRNHLAVLVASLSGLLLLPTATSSCSTVSKVNNTLDSAKKAADNVAALTKNFNETLNELKAQAKNATKAAPVSAAQVPALPPKVTSGVDIATPVMGKSGSGSADVEGSGKPEQVQVFEADQSTVTTASHAGSLHALDFATSDDATTFLAWQGDSEQGDAGKCYLGWEHAGKVWLVIAACGGSTAHVCSDDGNTASCAACNEAGACTECDENQPLDACTAPSGGVEDAGEADGGSEDAAP